MGDEGLQPRQLLRVGRGDINRVHHANDFLQVHDQPPAHDLAVQSRHFIQHLSLLVHAGHKSLVPDLGRLRQHVQNSFQVQFLQGRQHLRLRGIAQEAVEHALLLRVFAPLDALVLLQHRVSRKGRLVVLIVNGKLAHAVERRQQHARKAVARLVQVLHRKGERVAPGAVVNLLHLSQIVLEGWKNLRQSQVLRAGFQNQRLDVLQISHESRNVQLWGR